MNFERMEQQLILHEGLRLTPYLDTEGNLTVLVGYNVTGRGWEFMRRVLGRRVDETSTFTEDDAMKVLRADIERVVRAVRTYFPDYDGLDPVRQRVVVDLAFNMAFGALGFKRAIDALRRRDWSACARELYKSKWAYQVGDGPGKRRDRADRLAGMILTGTEPTDLPT